MSLMIGTVMTVSLMYLCLLRSLRLAMHAVAIWLAFCSGAGLGSPGLKSAISNISSPSRLAILSMGPRC
jgi:hypothetical protein